ncbi:hypothetical protein [Pseudomonas sp. DSP3-2-2]|uniref:hypothetical protein n=1 Tax=unclassified Pseudomonas TaxID=196821 RepID=UPI003CF45FDB
MATGDLDGDIGTAGMTSAQRAALKARLGQQTGELRSARMNLADLGSVTRQTSFDVSNTSAKYLSPTGTGPAAQSGGPVGRASQQIGGPAPLQASPQPEKPASLADAFSTGVGDGRSAIYAGVGANGEASFSNAPSSLNSLATNFTAPKLPPEQRVTSLAQYAPQGLAQAATMQPRQGAQPMALEDLSPGGRTVPAAPQRPVSLADIMPGTGAAPGRNADLASLGSARNLGDGVGTFSQAAAGDSALAMGRFQKANDLRDAYADQDRQRNAIAAQTRDSHFNVVRDSTQPVTRRELQFNEERKATTQSLANAVTGSQAIIDNRRQGVADDQQQRQANRLESLHAAALGPDATAEDQAALRRALDPTGKDDAGRRLNEAQIGQANARADNYRADSDKKAGLPVSLQKYEDADIEAIGGTRSMNSELGRIDKQLESGALVLGPWENAVSASRNAIGASDENSKNYASLNSTLEKLRNQSLALNKGTQTDGDAQRAWNELVTNIKDPGIVRQRLAEISQLNMRAASLRGAMLNNRRTSQGAKSLSVDSILGPDPQQPDQQGTPQTQGENGQQPQQATTQQRGPVYTISTADQFARLPSGADFIDPQGNHRRKP